MEFVRIQTQSGEDVLRTLVTSEEGLADEEAKRRLEEYGYNEIREAKKPSLTLKLLSQFTHFLAILLWIASALCFVSEYLHPGEGMLTLGIAIIAVICINAIFTFVQEYRAEKELEALRKLLPFRVKVLRKGAQKSVEASEVVPGDVVVLAEGDKIPADARLIESVGLKVNNAALTGESEPVARTDLPFAGELLESPNIVFAGTAVVSGSGKAAVFATGMGTEFGRIAHLTSAVESGLSPLQLEIVKATRLVATIAGVVGLFFFCLGLVVGSGFWGTFIFAIGITVALIPEGMLPTVTLSLAMGSQRMAKRRALMKTLTSVETLGAVTVICTDKTGTLTQNRMAVEALWFDGVPMVARDLRKDEAMPLLRVAMFCNNAQFSEGRYHGDPTEVALICLARDRVGAPEALRLREFPFDPDRRRMTTVNRIDGSVHAFSKGAVEHILPQCTGILMRDEIVVMDDRLRREVLRAGDALMDRGLRVLAFAHRDMKGGPDGSAGPGDVEKDMTFCGLMGLEDPLRPEVPGAIRQCAEAGIKVIMITGDSSRTALSIAREAGLVRHDPLVIEGHEIEEMNDDALRTHLSRREIVFARMTPKHKLRVVSVLKDEGDVVAVTGDGVNDAPALKRADIGIAMGISGTDVAKEASDMVLLDDNFATIVSAVEEGRAVYENIRKFITYIFASNIPEAVPYLAYILLGIPLPLTIIQILAVDLGTDMLPALALGTEKPTPGIMRQPPRSRDERLLNFPVIARAYLFLGPIEAVACMFGFFWVMYHGGWIWGTAVPHTDMLYRQATTVCLTAIIVAQVANVFTCRSRRESLLSIGLFTNALVFAGIAVEILLQLFIVYTPLGNRIFGTAPISVGMWLMLIPFGLALLLADEMRKWYVRKRFDRLA
jgi:sodium/potassium-transporting ATPase subunit alpha